MKYENHLSEIRKESGMTQREAAKRLGITIRAYQNYEQGERDMRSDKLKACAKLFGCTTDRILGI